MYSDWVKERNERYRRSSEVQQITKPITDMTNNELNYILKRFVLEVKKKTGDDYPAETLYELVVSLQLYLYLNGKSVKFLDDSDFDQLRNCLDNRMKELSRDGKVHPRNQAKVISVDEENLMWQRNVLGSDTPQKLVETLLYMFGVHFALRAGVEHRSLRFGDTSQISIHQENSFRFLLYKEDVSKTRQGGLEQIR